ncbi:MAG: hypothetical protein ABH863_05590 [Candidatus Micrarchaeota archaeon]
MAEKADEKKDLKKDEKKADGKADDKKEDAKKADPKDDKKSKQKEVISKLAAEEERVAPEKSPLNAPGHAKISFNFTFELDRSAKMKLPFLLAALLFLTFSFIMLEKVGLSFSDIFDFQRISHNFEKLFSISFILFMLLYTLSLGIGAFFGFNLRSSNAFVFSMLVILPLIIAFLLDPTHRYILAYIWLAFGFVLSVLFATLLEDLNFGSIYRTMGHALFIVLIVAVLFTAVKVGSNKEEYFDSFVGSIAYLTPQLQGQVQGSLGDMIERIEISDSELDNLVGDDPTSYMTDASIKSLVSLQYPSFRDVAIKSFKTDQDKEYAQKTIPATYSLIDAQSQTKLQTDTRTALKDPSARQVSGTAVKRLWPKIRSAMAESVRTAEPKAKLEGGDLSAIKSNLDEVSFVKQFKDYFEFFVALLVFSILSIAITVIRFLSSVFCFGITKVL